MSCEYGLEQVSAFLDRELPDGEREGVWQHIQVCGRCSEKLESMQAARRSIQDLSVLTVPAAVTARVQVIASHERQRRLVRLTIASFVRHRIERIRLAVDNLMQPMALPVTGGAISALLLFGVLFPSLMAFPQRMPDSVLSTNADGTVVIMGSNGEYMPASLVGLPQIVPVTFSNPADANVVELTIDNKGRVSDFTVASGSLTTDIRSIIMFSAFTPATVLGVPTSGKLKLVQRRPVYNIRTPVFYVRS